MKIYEFFKIPDEYDDESGLSHISLENKYTLYAITNNKKLAKRFKSERNMKLFICQVHDDIDSDEYAEMCNSSDYRSSVLELHKLDTVINNHTLSNLVEKEILMTNWEWQLTKEPQVTLDDESLWDTMPFPYIFTSGIIDVLEVLQYNTYYKLMIGPYLPKSLGNIMDANSDDDYSAPSISFDEVAIFISSIKSTL